MKNRLQFNRHYAVSQSREEALTALRARITDPDFIPLIGEPIVFRYKDENDNLQVILAIGKKAGHNLDERDYHVIDTADLDEKIAAEVAAREDLDAETIKRIVFDGVESEFADNIATLSVSANSIPIGPYEEYVGPATQPHPIHDNYTVLDAVKQVDINFLDLKDKVADEIDAISAATTEKIEEMSATTQSLSSNTVSKFNELSAGTVAAINGLSAGTVSGFNSAWTGIEGNRTLIDSAIVGAGLEPDGTYEHVHDASFIDDATSLKQADTILDETLAELSANTISFVNRLSAGTIGLVGELSASTIGAITNLSANTMAADQALQDQIDEIGDRKVLGISAITVTAEGDNSRISLLINGTDDKVLTQDVSGLKANISLVYTSENKKIYLNGKNGNVISEIDTSDFVKDGMLESADIFVPTQEWIDEHPEYSYLVPGETYLRLIFNTDSGKEPIFLLVKKLVDIYTVSASSLSYLTIEGYQIRANVDTADGLASKAAVDYVSAITTNIISATGLNMGEHGSYVPHDDTQVIKDAESLDQADVLLDHAVVTVSGMVETLSAGTIQLSADTKAAIASLSADTKGMVETLSAGTIQLSADTKAAIASLSAGTINDIRTLSGNVIEYVKVVSGNIETVVNTLSAGTIQLSADTKATINELSAGTIQLSADTKATINELSANTKSAIDALSANTRSVINELSANTNSAINTLSANTNSAINTLSANTNSAINELSANTKSAINELSAGTKTAIDTLSANTKSAIDSLSAGTKSAINELSANTKSAIDSLSAGTVSNILTLSSSTVGLENNLSTVSGSLITLSSITESFSGAVVSAITVISASTGAEVEALSAAVLTLSAATSDEIGSINTKLNGLSGNIVDLSAITSEIVAEISGNTNKYEFYGDADGVIKVTSSTTIDQKREKITISPSMASNNISDWDYIVNSAITAPNGLVTAYQLKRYVKDELDGDSVYVGDQVLPVNEYVGRIQFNPLGREYDTTHEAFLRTDNNFARLANTVGLDDDGVNAFLYPSARTEGCLVISKESGVTDVMGGLVAIDHYVEGLDWTGNTADSEVFAGILEANGLVSASTKLLTTVKLSGYSATANTKVNANQDLGTALGNLQGQINSMDKTASSEAGKFVRTVSETDGVVSETLGYILDSDVKITAATASELANLGSNVKEAWKLVNQEGTRLGEFVKIYKDSSSVEIYLGTSADTVDPATGVITKLPGDKEFLNYVYYTVNGTYEMVHINLEDFLTEPEFKSGLTVTNHIAHGVVDPASEAFLTVGGDGFKLSGVQDAIDTKVNALSAVVQDIDFVVAQALNELNNDIVELSASTVGINSNLNGLSGGTVSKINSLSAGTVSTINALSAGTIQLSADTKAAIAAAVSGALQEVKVEADGNNTKVSVNVGGVTKSGSATVPFASSADTIDGYHIVVGSTGNTPNTIYIL